MPLTDQFYGAQTAGVGRVIQDFGLCDLDGAYAYTAKLRPKGLLVVVFFSPDSDLSLPILKTVQAWTAAHPTQKWTALAVSDADRDDLIEYSKKNEFGGIRFVLDHELYQTRRWGVSNIPSLYLIAGKTGRVLEKVFGAHATTLETVRARLETEIAKVVAAEDAAKKAAEAKQAEAAAAKK